MRGKTGPSSFCFDVEINSIYAKWHEILLFEYVFTRLLIAGSSYWEGSTVIVSLCKSCIIFFFSKWQMWIICIPLLTLVLPRSTISFVSISVDYHWICA